MDKLDINILAILQQDGRMTNAKLARTVGLSPTAALARVRRLMAEGYIVAYEARLDPRKTGVAFLVFVEVLLDRTTTNVFDAFNAAVQKQPQIMACYMVAGGFDYLLKIRCKDMDGYRRFAGDVLWKLPGVRETRTYPVMEEIRDSTRITLPDVNGAQSQTCQSVDHAPNGTRPHHKRKTS